MSRVVLQKLLVPGTSSQVTVRGYDQVGGLVVEAASAVELRTPDAIRTAYGLADDGAPWLDVVRFVKPACATLSRPSGVERPWPSYPSGFLRPVGESIIPVWSLSTTRYSPGAEVWRIHADGQQERVSTYLGAARGWTGAREWRPASRYYGTRADWQGTEYAADVGGDALELTSFVQPDGDGWMQHRPMTWSRVVTIAECEVYELEFRATLQEVPVRVLEVIDGNVRLQLLTDDPQVAGALNAGMVDFGVFEMSGVPGALLTGTQLVANQLVSA